MGRPFRILQNEFPYHVMTRTNNKEFRFKDKRSNYLLFAKVINQGIKKYGVQVSHFILMDNHYHIIFKTPNKNIHRFMQFVNSMIAREYNKRHKRTGHLWGDRYKSTIIEVNEYYKQCIQYIYTNPVRAGIVKHPKDYQPSTFEFYAFNKKIDLCISGDSIFIPEETSPHEFLKLFDNNINTLDINFNKQILGSDLFKKLIKAKYL